MISCCVRCALLFVLAASFPACGAHESPTQPAVAADCVMFALAVPPALEVGQKAAVSPFIESCKPNLLRIDPALVTWQSLDPAIVAVSAAGVEGLAPGVGVVQGIQSGMSAQNLIAVGSPGPGPATAVRLRIVGSPIMVVQQRTGFTAFVELSNGTATDVSALANWNSSNIGVGLIVMPPAVVQAVKNGATTMTASYGGMRAEMTVKVGQ